MRKQKTEKQLLEKELNDLWKKVSRMFLEKKCVACGGRLSTWHHFIPKSKCTRLRYDIQNSIPICVKCHYNIHHGWKPTDVANIVNKIIEVRGKKWHNYILLHERDTIRKNMKWLNEQKEILLNITGKDVKKWH